MPFLDATLMVLGRDTVQKGAVLLGICIDGTKEIIDYSIATDESKSNWKEIRSSIYTTNMIGSYNKQLKRHFKAKEQTFKGEDTQPHT